MQRHHHTHEYYEPTYERTYETSYEPSYEYEEEYEPEPVQDNRVSTSVGGLGGIDLAAALGLTGVGYVANSGGALHIVGKREAEPAANPHYGYSHGHGLGYHGHGVYGHHGHYGHYGRK